MALAFIIVTLRTRLALPAESRRYILSVVMAPEDRRMLEEFATRVREIERRLPRPSKPAEGP